MKYIILVIFLFLFSCNEKIYLLDGEIKIVNSYPIDESISGTPIELQSIGITNIFIIDTFLITHQFQGIINFFDVYSTGNLAYCGSYLEPGRGPEEFLNPLFHGQYVKDDIGIKFWIKDATNLKFSLININESIKEHKTVVDKNILYSRIIGNGGFIIDDSTVITFLGDDVDANVFINTYDLKNQDLLDQKYIFKNVSSLDSDLTNFIPAISKDEKTIIFGMYKLNAICIFDPKLENCKTIYLDNKSPKYKKLVTIDNQDRPIYNAAIRPTTNSFFSLYLNQSWNKRSTHSEGVEILQFDYDGNPMSRFKINETIIFFAIDEINKCIYGLTPEEVIYKYDISKYI